MEEKLKKIIEEHELNLVKYTQERDNRNANIGFMIDHSFKHEVQFLQGQKDAVSDIFYDYRTVVENLRELLNSWNS